MNIQIFDFKFQAIEDLENELDRLRKTALIHKQLERFVEDSMFKLDELAARFEFEEKKTGDMEGNLAILKTTISEMDTVGKKFRFFIRILIILTRQQQMSLLQKKNCAKTIDFLKKK